MSPTYAAKTTVLVENSRAEIERILSRYGAQAFAYGWDQRGAQLELVKRAKALGAKRSGGARSSAPVRR